MKKTEKRTKANAPKRPYSKPQLEQVRLIAEEAVLAHCKTPGQTVQGGPTSFPNCEVGINLCLDVGT